MQPVKLIKGNPTDLNFLSLIRRYAQLDVELIVVLQIDVENVFGGWYGPAFRTCRAEFCQPLGRFVLFLSVYGVG